MPDVRKAMGHAAHSELHAIFVQPLSVLIHDAPQGNQEEFQTHLEIMRSLWRGWQIILFLDRAPAHTAAESMVLADDLGMALRWLPVACPKLNPMDHLWRHIKGEVWANCPYHSLDEGMT
jgi:hypothetical protein